MGNGVSTLVITGNQERHGYAARRLLDQGGLLGLVSEAKKPRVKHAKSAVLARHYESFEEAQHRYFPCCLPEIKGEIETLNIDNRKVNNHDTVDWIRRINPDYFNSSYKDLIDHGFKPIKYTRHMTQTFR